MDYGLQYKVEKQEVYYHQADQLQTTYYHANVESQPQATYSQAEPIQQTQSKIKKVSGYILFASKKRHEFKAKHPNASFVELTKIMSSTWKEMDESDKTPWRNEAIRLNKVHRDENPRSSRPPGVKNTTGSKPLTSGFLVFASYNRKAMHASNPGMGFGEISRILGERWRQMDAEEKQKWAETRLANADSKDELQQKSLITHAFENAVKGEPLEMGGRGQKQKMMKGDKPLSSGFLVFASYNRKQMHQNHPGMSFGEISKILGERWRQLTPAEKQKWAETPLPENQGAGGNKGEYVNGVLAGDTTYGASDTKPLVIDEFHTDMSYASSSNATGAAQQSTSYTYQNQTYPQATAPKQSRPGKVKTKGRKGVVTGFVLFGAENRKILRAAHPDKPFGKLSIMLSEAWKNLKDNERAMWRAQALEANKAAKLLNMQAAKQQQQHQQQQQQQQQQQHHDQHQVVSHQQHIQHHQQQQAQQQQQQEQVTKIDFTDIVENPNGNVIYDCCWNQCNAQFKYKADFLLHTIEKCVKNGPRATYTVKGAYRYNCLWRGCKNSMGYANFEKVIQHVRFDHIVRNEGHTLLEMKQESMDHQASTVDTTQINMNTPVITISGDQFPGTSQYTVNQQQQIVGDQWAYAGTYNGQPITYVVLQPSNQMQPMTQTVLQLSNNVLQPVQTTQNVESHQVVTHDQYGNEVPSVTNRPFTIKKVGEPGGGGGGGGQQTQVVVSAQSHQQTPVKKEKNPKRMGNTTGFILFQGQKRKELVEKQAQSKDKYNFGQISKMLGEMWEKLPEEERAMWKAKAQEQNRQKRAALAAGGMVQSPQGSGAGGGGQPLKTSTPIVNASTSKNQNFELAPSSSDHNDESNHPAMHTATGMIQDEGAITDATKHFFDVQTEVQKTLKIWLYAFTTYITTNGVNFVEILTSLQFDVDAEENIDLRNFFTNLSGRLQRGDYKRLDHFQCDVFAFFERIRQLMEPTGPLLKALVDAQMFFIRTRNKLCANGKRMQSPALSHGPQHLEKLLKNNKNGIFGTTEFFQLKPRHDAILLRSSYFLYVKDDSVHLGTAIVKFDSFYGEDNSMFTGLYFTICTNDERKFLSCDVRNAVICQQVDQKAYSCAAIMGRCMVLNEHDHATRRPTEIPEKDVYICIARKIAENRYELSKVHHFLDGILDYDVNTLEPDKIENSLLPEVATLNYQAATQTTETADPSVYAIDAMCEQISAARGIVKVGKHVVIDDDLKHLMEIDEDQINRKATTVNNNEIDEPTIKRICQGLQATAFDLYKDCNKRIFGNTLETEWDKLDQKDKLYWESTANKMNYSKLIRQYPQSAVCQITRASELGTFSLFAAMQSSYFPNIYLEANTLVKVWTGLKQKEKEYYKKDLDEMESRNWERMMAISIVSNANQNIEPQTNIEQITANFQNATSLPILCGIYEYHWNNEEQQFEGLDDFHEYAQRLIFDGKTNGPAYQCMWNKCPNALAAKHFGLDDLKQHVNSAHLKNPPYKIININERSRHFIPIKMNQDFHQQQTQQQYMEH